MAPPEDNPAPADGVFVLNGAAAPGLDEPVAPFVAPGGIVVAGPCAGTSTFALPSPVVTVGWDGPRSSAPDRTGEHQDDDDGSGHREHPVAPADRGDAADAAFPGRVERRRPLHGDTVIGAVREHRRAAGGPGQNVVGARRGDVEGRPGAREERGEAVVVEHGHGPVSSERGASPAPARAHRAGSAARRRRASCRRDFTVPGRRPMARAMSRSLRSA